MANPYAKHFSTKSTPQSEPIPGKAQVKNNAGGFVFGIDDWARLQRFLIIGAEGGTYYVSERKLTIDNAQCVVRCLNSDYKRTVDAIVAVSDGGKAPKNDPAIFALAICAGMGIPEARKYAMSMLSKVCRIGTHLFQFLSAVREFRGFGSSLKNGIANWYTSKTDDDLAYQLVKYQQRDGVSHRDVLRLCHFGQNTPLYRWIIGNDCGPRHVKGNTERKRQERNYHVAEGELPEIIQAFEAAKAATSAANICNLITDHNLPRECIPTQWLNDKSVWEALLQKMPLTALIRNLGKMSSIELLKPLSSAVNHVLSKLGDRDYIHKSRLHPMNILVSLRTYAQGRGDKGKLTWQPVPQIIDALDSAFYTAFDNVEPTGGGWLIGVDVSGSMGSPIAGLPLSCCEAATAMALVTAHVEPNYMICAFDSGMKQLPISKKTRLDDALRHTRNINGGGTDCSMPMFYAIQQNLSVQNFMVLTDNETWAGHMGHPCQALQQYRRHSGINSKLVVCAMSASEFSIADPNDPGTLDICGFSTDVPTIISEFARG